MRYLAKAVLLAAVVLFPALAHAQSLTGVVRDGSGGVLPGVTVEAASPALIEKVRTVVSDGSGQYRLENLPPGSYSVTYTLPGFSGYSTMRLSLRCRRRADTATCWPPSRAFRPTAPPTAASPPT